MMTDNNIWWTCPICDKNNISYYNGYKNEYACRQCKKKFVIDVEVEVNVVSIKTLDEYEKEEAERQRERHMATLEVSSDGGKTWEMKRVDCYKVKLDESDVKPGDLVITGGVLWLINMYDSDKVGAVKGGLI